MATPTIFVVQQGADQKAAPGQRFLLEIIIQLLNENSNPMPAEPVVWLMPPTGAGGTFEATGNSANLPAVTDAQGFTRQFVRANSELGAWAGAIQATNAPSLLGFYGMTNTTSGTPYPNTLIGPSAQSVALNGAYQPFQAVVRDQYNDALPNSPVSFTVPAGHGTFAGGGLTATVNTNAQGTATSPVFTANNVPGSFTLTTTALGNSNVSAESTTLKNVDTSVPTQVQLLAGNNQSTNVSTLFAQPLSVTVYNGLGGVVPGVSVTFTSPASGASCTFPTLFAATTAVTNAQGVATSPRPLANAVGGSYTVTATVPGATGAQFRLTNGVTYGPEQNSGMVVPAGTAQIGANSGIPESAWANTNNALSTTDQNGAFWTLSTNPASSQVLWCGPFPASVLAQIPDDAKITFIYCELQVEESSVNQLPIIPMTLGIYNYPTQGAVPGTGGVKDITPTAGFVWENKAQNYSAPSTMTGATLKAGSYGVGIIAASQNYTSFGSMNVRAVKMRVSWTPVAPPPPSAGGGLFGCEA
jgi:hypothetical protein